ncbi:thioester domain-containing protein [Micromonospora zhanjiangensis]
MFGQRGSRWARLAIATVAGAALTLGAAGPAGADPPVTGTHGEVKDGSARLLINNKVYDEGQFTLTIGDKTAVAYCIDLNTGVARGGEYQEGTWDASKVKNLGKVQWILTHGYPNGDGTALLTAAKATLPAGTDQKDVNRVLYFGTQTAIWHYSDDAVLNSYVEGKKLLAKPLYDAVEAIYKYMTAAATDQPEPKPTLTISPEKAKPVAVGAKAGPFTVEGPGGKIELAVEGGKAVDADGKEITSTVNGGKFWLTGTGANTVKVTATGSGSVSFGRVFLFTGGKPAQKLILGGSVGEKVSARAEASFQQAPAGPTLPVTGDSTTLVIGVGVVLLVAGAVTMLIVRRRKVRFTV